jgi:uncharacterized protein (TIGR02996 family)
MTKEEKKVKKAMFQEVLDHPREHDRKMVFSDWLEEHGENDLAFAMRWMGKRKMYPEVAEVSTDGNKVWFWQSDDVKTRHSYVPSYLLHLIVDHDFGYADNVSDENGLVLFYTHQQGAMEVLARAIKLVRMSLKI